jgi:hypothetical protein
LTARFNITILTSDAEEEEHEDGPPVWLGAVNAWMKERGFFELVRLDDAPLRNITSLIAAGAYLRTERRLFARQR